MLGFLIQWIQWIQWIQYLINCPTTTSNKTPFINLIYTKQLSFWVPTLCHRGFLVWTDVSQLVKKLYPSVRKIKYSVEVKTDLVLRAKQLFSKKLIEFDMTWVDLAHAFVTIHQTSTQSGRSVTYRTSRTSKAQCVDVELCGKPAVK